MDSTSEPSEPKGPSRARNYVKALGRKAKDKLRTFSRSTLPIDDSATDPASIPPSSPYLVDSFSGHGLSTGPPKVHQSEPTLSTSLPAHSLLQPEPPETSLYTRSSELLDKNNRGWEGLRSGLQILQDAIEVFPPLQSAIATLISCLELFEVGFGSPDLRACGLTLDTQTACNNRQGYGELGSELQGIAIFLAQHLQDPRSAHMVGVIITISNWVFLACYFQAIDDRVRQRTIDREVKLIEERHNQKMGRRLIAARYNEDTSLKDYRRIENLFRRLQVNHDRPNPEYLLTTRSWKLV